MRKRYSIYPNPELDKLLEARAVGAIHNDDRAEPLRGRSATITTMCVRYAEAIRQHTPALTANEWMFICDSLNGYWMNDDVRLSAHGIAHNVADAAKLSDTNSRFDVDGEELARKIDAMLFIEKLAIMDVSERFWSGNPQDDESYESLFDRLTERKRANEKTKNQLERAVEIATSMAYEEDADMVISTLDGSWHIAHSEDLAMQRKMTGPKFIVTDSGIKAPEAAFELESCGYDFDWHDGLRVYHIQDETIAIQLYPPGDHGDVLINQMA